MNFIIEEDSNSEYEEEEYFVEKTSGSIRMENFDCKAINVSAAFRYLFQIICTDMRKSSKNTTS